MKLNEKYNNGNIQLTAETAKEVIQCIIDLQDRFTTTCKFIANVYHYSDCNREHLERIATKGGKHLKEFLQACVLFGRGDLELGMLRKRGDYRFGIACKLPTNVQRQLLDETVVFAMRTDDGGWDDIRLDFWKMTQKQINQVIDTTESRVRSKAEQIQYLNAHGIPQPVRVEWTIRHTNKTPKATTIKLLEEKLAELQRAL